MSRRIVQLKTGNKLPRASRCQNLKRSCPPFTGGSGRLGSFVVDELLQPRTAALIGRSLALVAVVTAGCVVLGVALALGFRSGAGPLAWLGVAGMLALLTVALTWLTVALGLAAASVETASNTPMFLMLLPFLGSGFVPVDSMPAGLRWFAAYQPFTPVIDTLRGLLGAGSGSGAGPGTDAALAVGWCVVITVGSLLWSRRLYETRAAR